MSINTDMSKPYSESCDQNKDVILSVITPILKHSSSVLEIGSGTGQHAIYFSENLPDLIWHTSDCEPYLAGINAWLIDSKIKNVKAPIELDVSHSKWPVIKLDAIFTANSVHIMSSDDMKNLICGAGRLLETKGCLIIYGPFNYNGAYTSESNQRFDQWLKQRNKLSCIKDFETVQSLANDNGMKLVHDYEMPANNRILHFVKE